MGFERKRRSPAIVTNLDNYFMPFIRYDIGDMLLTSDTHCSCGRHLSTIDQIEGRTHDYLVASDGRLIPGEFIPHLFQKAEGFTRYFVHQVSTDEVIVRVVPNERYSEDETQSISKVLKSHLGGNVSVTFEIVEEESLPSSRSGKLFFVKSEVKAQFE